MSAWVALAEIKAFDLTKKPPAMPKFRGTEQLRESFVKNVYWPVAMLAK